MSMPLRFGVAHDFRCPPGSPYSMQDVYAQTLEQVRLLDAAGLDLVWFSEHHFVDDGYLPSFVPVAAAVAAQTSRIRISTDITLLPFAHPLRLAEDLAVLEQISNGRMELGAGLGYAQHEFATFGVPVSQRVSRTEECLEILQLAFQGERFNFHGKRYQFENVQITPGYVQAGGPPLWLASTNPLAMERAIRFNTHLLPQGRRTQTLDNWRVRLGELGRDPAQYRVGIIRSIYVTDDRERDWPALRAAERYRMQVYGGFANAAGSGGIEKFADEERITQRAVAGTVGECVQELVSFIREFGLTDVVTWGSAPGVAPAQMTPMMLRFATEVVPQVRAIIEGTHA